MFWTKLITSYIFSSKTRLPCKKYHLFSGESAVSSCMAKAMSISNIACQWYSSGMLTGGGLLWADDRRLRVGFIQGVELFKHSAWL
jgi:hypothetical protein